MRCGYVLNSLGDTLAAPDVSAYVSAVHSRLVSAKPSDVFFLNLATDNYQPDRLMVLMDALRRRAAADVKLTVIGVPDWTGQDLRFCHDKAAMSAVQVIKYIHFHDNRR